MSHPSSTYLFCAHFSHALIILFECVQRIRGKALPVVIKAHLILHQRAVLSALLTSELCLEVAVSHLTYRSVGVLFFY